MDNPPDVPDFELIRRIGEGGFGHVWLAVNRPTGRLRAVKLIPLNRSGTADPAGREVASLTRLEASIRHQHPNLVHIYHVGQTTDHLFYVMEPADDVSGAPATTDPSYQPASLESRTDQGPLPPAESLRYARQLLAGLACLHEAGMVHRDVKPANCLFVDGQLKLADFGLLTEADQDVSRLGTMTYMPPDGRMDIRADVYATGLVIYEMVTGLPADSFPRLGDRAREIAGDPILAALNRLTLRACQPNPQERFRDAQAMLAELENPVPPITSWRKRGRLRIAAAIMGLVMAVALALVAWRASLPPRVHVNFITHPFGARIYLDRTLLMVDKDTPYVTPCTVDDLLARVHQVELKHDDYPDTITREMNFANTREIEVSWETEP